MTILHHHLIYQARVGRTDLDFNAEEILKKFMFDLLKEVDMKILITPQFKFSQQKAWTGIMGIVTSHISFHYWTVEQYVQLDIYSCKAFDRKKAIAFLTHFWKASGVKTLFIDREIGKNFKIQEN